MADKSPAPGASVSRRAKGLFALLLAIGVPIIAFVTIEGVSSLLLLAKQVTTPGGRRLAEEVSTDYDSELGWIAKKSHSSPDLYGPGIALHTNARGFRGREEVGDARPEGRRRLVCLGDSFTLGYGVADDETWCARLAAPQLQTVNMGQGGYGIDQAYLWYARDARAMQHDVQVLALITDDFRRMVSDRFLNFAKPRLAVRDDSLVVEGVPVPRPRRESWRDRLLAGVRSLQSARLLAGLTTRAGASRPAARGGSESGTPDDRGLRQVVAYVIGSLARLNAGKGSRLLLVYLPVETDFQNEASAPWRQAMRGIADSLNVPLLDLIPVQRRLDRQAMRALYIPRGDIAFARAAGHLTAEGNRWAAEHISRALDSLDQPWAATHRR